MAGPVVGPAFITFLTWGAIFYHSFESQNYCKLSSIADNVVHCRDISADKLVYIETAAAGKQILTTDYNHSLGLISFISF